MPKRTQALRDFRSSIAIAETLMGRERRFADPPVPRQVKVVQGLRGAAAVLMVAAFENFLKEVVEEALYELTHHPLRFDPAKLPEDMVFHNFSQTLDHALNGPFTKGKKHADKIIVYKQASQIIITEVINSQVFSDLTRSNPNSKKVRELFKSMGMGDIFAVIKVDFDATWGVATAQTFIADTLDSILDRRHQVAHTGSALNISRIDLQTSVRFLRILADICEAKLLIHIENILT